MPADLLVVGIDATPQSWHALEWAADEAARSGRTLRLVHAWHWSDAVFDPWPAEPVAHHATAPQASRRLLRRAATQVAGRAPVEVRSVEASPVVALVEGSADADMLVLGTHRRSSVGAMVLGSVSAGCARACHCPVVLVPTEVATAPDGPPPGRRPAVT